MPKSLCMLVLAVLFLACPLAVQAQPATVGARLPITCNTSLEAPHSAYFVAGFMDVSGAGDLSVNLTGVSAGPYDCIGRCYGETDGAAVSLAACGVATESGHLVIDVPGFYAPLMEAALNNDHIAVYRCSGLFLTLRAVNLGSLDVGCDSGPVDMTRCAPAGGVCPCGACP
jgi:hypothetical protein